VFDRSPRPNVKYVFLVIIIIHQVKRVAHNLFAKVRCDIYAITNGAGAGAKSIILCLISIIHSSQQQ
jgi:hypothetical protein